MISTPTFTTFWKLIQNYKIQIPIIQRDYAQGRSDEQATSIRNKFLDSLHKALINKEPLDLDFVYGNIEDGRFLPLDGQQRLTTLFLLHWYLAAAENKLESARPFLEHFTYETRSSSREFCNKLISVVPFTFVIGTTDKLSKLVQDASWFQPAWERDPTVRAMLTMLDAIQSKFQLNALFTQLIDETDPLIRFHFLELKNAGLTDDLYLKMNARGKPLTDFENWKAEFDLFLQQTYPDLHRQFGQKIDGVWIDIFWPFRDLSSALIDKPFKRYLDFVTRMIGLQQGKFHANSVKSDNVTFKHYQIVYELRENALFLFSTLDYLYKAGDTNELTRNLFTTNNQEGQKTRIFDGRTHFVKQCLLNENFDIKSQVLFFSLLQYVIVTGESLGDIFNLKHYLRVMRNLLERVRQQNDTVINSNLREGELADYLGAVKKLIPSVETGLVSVYEVLALDSSHKINGFTHRSIEHERLKARLIQQTPDLKQAIHGLEDLLVFRGDLHNLDLENNAAHLPNFRKAITEMWSDSQAVDLIIPAWLTEGDYGVRTSNTMIGAKYFYGNQENWYTILANDKDELRTMLPQFLNAYITTDLSIPSEKLEQLIQNWLNEQHTKDWRYYFIKYPQMTQDSQGYFARDDGFTITSLTTNSLKGKHIHPFVKAVVKITPTGSLLTESSHYINGYLESPLYFKTMNMYALVTNSGWLVQLSQGYDLPIELKEKYSIQLDETNRFWLHEDTDLDMIELMVAFATDMKNYDVIKVD